MLVEVLAQFLVGRCRPAGAVGAGEPGDYPPRLGQRRARLDELLERGPAGLPVLAGDGELGVVQDAELPGGQPPLRLELQVPETGLVGERA
jgi:hypothetical protein